MAKTATTMQATADAISARAEVEYLLYAEAVLLDTCDLEVWLALFTDDGSYLVP